MDAEALSRLMKYKEFLESQIKEYQSRPPYEPATGTNTSNDQVRVVIQDREKLDLIFPELRAKESQLVAASQTPQQT